MFEVGGHAAEGSGIEVHRADYSVLSMGKIFHLHFVIRMGSRGTFVLCTDVPGSML